MYDEYVSLGANCEIAFQFRRVLGHFSSGFFAWNVTRFDALFSLLDTDFAGILDDSNLTMSPGARLMHDSSHDFKVHAPFKSRNYRDEPDSDKIMAEIRTKFKYFIDKFHDIIASNKRIAYFYKVDNTLDDTNVVRQSSEELLQRLYNLHGDRPFALIILQHEKNREADWDIPMMFNRYLKRIAPPEDATDGHVYSWDKVFREFPHLGGLTLAS